MQEPAPSRWKHRYPRNVARLRSEQPDQIRLVVAELTERERRYGLSQGETRMLVYAKNKLSELEGPSSHS
jgi:RNA polymerase-interacting CarD/CdnL/TRCF family regulator